jgi:hypothetical protein
MEIGSKDKFNELSYYTLGHADPAYFIHQHIVDAYTAQSADENIKPISITFSLAGLYLYLEKNYSGRQVQQAHMKLSQGKKVWPEFQIPAHKGEITVSNVLTAAPGQARDLMIKQWCVSVWQAYRNCHTMVALLVKERLGV